MIMAFALFDHSPGAQRPSEMRQTLFLKEMGFHVQGEVWSGLQPHPGTARWTIRETSGVQLSSLEDKLVERTRDFPVQGISMNCCLCGPKMSRNSVSASWVVAE